MKKKIGLFLILLICFFSFNVFKINKTSLKGTNNLLAVNTIANTVKVNYTAGSGIGSDYSTTATPAVKNYNNNAISLITNKGTTNYTHDDVTKSISGQNKTYHMILTGWKLVSVVQNGETLTTHEEPDKYNYADNTNAKKDIGMVYTEAGYYIVPEGVTEVTFEAVYGWAIYIKDPYTKMVFDTNYWLNVDESIKSGRTGSKDANYGTNDSTDVVASLKRAYEIIRNSGEVTDEYTLYDHVIVLMGNVHEVKASAGSTPSYCKTDTYESGKVIDCNGNSANWADNTGNVRVTITSNPNGTTKYNLNVKAQSWGFNMYGGTRYDYVNWKANDTVAGGVQKANPAMYLYKVSNLDYQIETTERFTSSYSFALYTYGRANYVVLKGGSLYFALQAHPFTGNYDVSNLKYVLVGGNANLSAYHNTSTSELSFSVGYVINPPTLAVTGGTISNVYLSGQSSPGVIQFTRSDDTVYMFTSGGRFGNIYGSGGSRIEGNSSINLKGVSVTGTIFGGGSNAKGIITGDVDMNITNSTLNTVYGGPQFGDILGTTNVKIDKSTVSGNVYGGGYGDTSNTSTRRDSQGNLAVATAIAQLQNADHCSADGMTCYDAANTELPNIKKVNNQYRWYPVMAKANEVITKPMSDYLGFYNSNDVLTTRIYFSSQTELVTITNYWYQTTSSLSSASVNDVNLTISGSTVNGDVYGGGNKGSVKGNIVLNIIDSTIKGTLYGGGYTITNNTVALYDNDYKFEHRPYAYLNGSTLAYSGEKNTTNHPYTWRNYNYLLKNSTAWTTAEIEEYDSLYGDGAYLNAKVINGVDYVNKVVYSNTADKMGTVYGNTTINLDNSTVNKSVYGGGYAGIVNGNTKIYVKRNTNILGSLYGGGNAADIKGNSYIGIENGTISGNVFGGGNQGHVGIEGKNSNNTKIDITGGTINGNVYGGGNTSKVFGHTTVNIGKNVSSDASLIKNSITIGGTVFGGGEANASGSDTYDFSYIAVTNGVDIKIDGKDYSTFLIKGSIFGSGNASTSEGESTIIINNYGSSDNIKKNISIQRANKVELKNSHINLSGTTDRTNEFSNEIFTISRVDEFVIEDNSYLYIENGTNLLMKWTSKNNGVITTDANPNHLYIMPGKNLKVTTSQDATSYGVVEGITYLGIYDPETFDKGIYGEPATNKTFTSGVYVLGAHSDNIKVNGFISSFQEDSIKKDFVTPVPDNQSYHIWRVGGEVYLENISLAISKYEVLGGFANVVFPLSSSDTTYSITNVDVSNLASGVNLIDPSEIPNVYTNSDDALKNIGIEMRTGTGWQEDDSFTFLSASGGSYNGKSEFLTESLDTKPNVEFYVYNAKNIDKDMDLGYITVTLEGIKQVSALEREFKTVIITINLSSVRYDSFDYEGQISSGHKYEKFGNSATNINTTSSFSTYFEAVAFRDTNPYVGSYERILTSNFAYAKDTTITMLDLVNNKYYYYIVTDDDAKNNKTQYKLKEFKEMGSTDKTYSDTTNYYDTTNKLVLEKFIFIVDFKNSKTNERLNNSLLLELKEANNKISIKPNDNALLNINYNILEGENTYSLTNQIDKKTIREDEDLDAFVSVEIKQASSNLMDIEDTKNQFKKQGLKISFYKDGKKLTASELLGVTLLQGENEYYVNSHGEIIVLLQNKVNSIIQELKIRGLKAGEYTIKEEYTLSSSGIYFSDSIATDEEEITVLPNDYGLVVDTSEEEKVVHQENNLNMNFKVNYSSSLVNPNIRLSVYKKKTKDASYLEYDLLNIKDYITSNFDDGNDNEIIVNNKPTSSFEVNIIPNENLTSGTYKFEFKLYDGDSYIGNYIVYKIIK